MGEVDERVWNKHVQIMSSFMATGSVRCADLRSLVQFRESLTEEKDVAFLEQVERARNRALRELRLQRRSRIRENESCG